MQLFCENVNIKNGECVIQDFLQKVVNHPLYENTYTSICTIIMTFRQVQIKIVTKSMFLNGWDIHYRNYACHNIYALLQAGKADSQDGPQ